MSAVKKWLENYNVQVLRSVFKHFHSFYFINLLCFLHSLQLRLWNSTEKVMEFVTAAKNGQLKQLSYSLHYFFLGTRIFLRIWNYEEEEGVKRVVECLTKEENTVHKLR